MKIVKIMGICIMLFWAGITIYKYANGYNWGVTDAKKTGEQVFEYLKSEDIEGLKTLFSERVSNTYDLDKELGEFFELVDGNIITYSDFSVGSSSERISEGKQVYLSYVPYFRDVKTDTGKVYQVTFVIYLINQDARDKVGVASLRIMAEDKDIFYVGEK